MDPAPGIAADRNTRVALYPFGSRKSCARSPLPPQSPPPRTASPGPALNRFRSASPGQFSREPTPATCRQASSAEMVLVQSARLLEPQDGRGIPVPAFQYKANTADMLDMALSWHLCGLDPDVASTTMILRISPGKYELDANRISLWWNAAKQEVFVRDDGVGGDAPDVSLASHLKQLSRMKASTTGAAKVSAKVGDVPSERAREGRRRDVDHLPGGGTVARKVGPADRVGTPANRPRKSRDDAAYLPLSEVVARVGGVSL